MALKKTSGYKPTNAPKVPNGIKSYTPPDPPKKPEKPTPPKENKK
jgi:hypothetical protein